MKVLVIGVTGMLGSMLFQNLSHDKRFTIYGTMRKTLKTSSFENIFTEIDVISNFDKLVEIIYDLKPDYIINCVGIVKQNDISNNPLIILPINSVFPHQISKITKEIDSKLIHISTDCVFNGDRGNYLETEFPEAADLYGISKILGEVVSDNSLTLRCSLIGPEQDNYYGLLSWFLNQKKTVVVS